jgi:hypothetical protein
LRALLVAEYGGQAIDAHTLPVLGNRLAEEMGVPKAV